MYVPQLSHRTNEDMTALHLAVEAGRANVVEALIGLGANVHSKVMVTLCIVRVGTSNCQDIDQMQGGPLGETALHLACRLDAARGERCVRMRLRSGAAVNARAKGEKGGGNALRTVNKCRTS